MKKIFTLLFLTVISVGAFARPVDETTAKKVGKHFLGSRTGSVNTTPELELAYVSRSSAKSANSSFSSQVFFYVFNVSNGDGFVIISADDQVVPVLGYSTEKDFYANNMSQATAKWLEGYKGQIRYAVQNNLPQTTDIRNAWASLTSNTPSEVVAGKKGSVSPLVSTKWDQTGHYKALCPGGSVTGCVATAMAQVMKYWNYPASGSGFHSYNHSQYGNLSADFGSTTYNWGSMPNVVNSANSSVATLMYHAGVSVDMGYSPQSSGAYVISDQSAGTHCAEYALKTYFSYKSTLSGIQRDNYNETQWISILKNELDMSRPMLYAGFGSGGGHAFVCDGYDNNDYFHFNWGWGGYQDGYFEINALNPGGTGTGGGTGGFNAGHQLIIGIEPANGNSNPVDDLSLNVDVTPSAVNIGYGSAFSVSTKIVNTGTTTFTGTYCAAVFDANDVFVDYVDSLVEPNGLPAGYTYTNNLVFSSAGNFNLLPADNYKIYIFYKPLGGNWKRIFGASGSIDDYAYINIKNSSDIEMYEAMTPTPAKFIKGQSASVHLDIANVGSSQFSGSLNLSLFNLDGSFAGTIEQMDGLSLPASTHYQGGLTFSTANLDVAPGTYLLALQYQRTGSGNYYLVGSTAYQNPVKITVIDPPILADVYEVNNTVQQAYSLPVNFTGNTAKASTPGSNVHTGSDYDYYKLVLPTGSDYTIAARIHDTYNSGNSQVYTLDGLVSYSLDGTNWSDAFEDIIDGTIQVPGGGTVYFLVSPYFSGQTGTYLFDATVTRSGQQSIEKDITGFSVTGIVGSAAISSANATVNVTVTASTDVTALVPTISISPMASINPNSGVSRDFSTALTYTVTAQDGSTKVWTVTVTKQAPNAVAPAALEEQITVYPNPAADVLNIDLQTFGYQVNSISLVDAQGKVHQVTEGVGPNQLAISLEGFSAGFYILRIETEAGIINKKVMIQP